MKDIPKTWILTGKQFEDLRQKKRFWPQPDNHVEHTVSKYSN